LQFGTECPGQRAAIDNGAGHSRHRHHRSRASAEPALDPRPSTCSHGPRRCSTTSRTRARARSRRARRPVLRAHPGRGPACNRAGAAGAPPASPGAGAIAHRTRDYSPTQWSTSTSAACLAGTPSATTCSHRRVTTGRRPPILRGVDYTHDLSRLSACAFIAVNTAIELDRGQVNVKVSGQGDWRASAATPTTGRREDEPRWCRSSGPIFNQWPLTPRRRKLTRSGLHARPRRRRHRTNRGQADLRGADWTHARQTHTTLRPLKDSWP